jgi:hypothetical protein
MLTSALMVVWTIFQTLLAKSLGPLAVVATDLLFKLIGTEFIAKILLLAMDRWCKSTPSKWDDAIEAAVAKAWNVNVVDLNALPQKQSDAPSQ